MSQRSHTHRHSLNALLPVSNGQVFVALVFCFFFNQRHRPSEFSEQRPSQSSVGISPIAETRWHQSRSRLCAVSQTTTIINSKITTTTTTAARPTRQKSKRTTFPGKKCFFSFFDSLSCRRLLLLLFGLFYLFEYVNVTLYDDKKAHSPFCGRWKFWHSTHAPYEEILLLQFSKNIFVSIRLFPFFFSSIPYQNASLWILANNRNQIPMVSLFFILLTPIKTFFFFLFYRLPYWINWFCRHKRNPQDFHSNWIDIQRHVAPGLPAPWRLSDPGAGPDGEARFGLDARPEQLRVCRRRSDGPVLFGQPAQRFRVSWLHHPAPPPGIRMGQELHVLELRRRRHNST